MAIRDFYSVKTLFYSRVAGKRPKLNELGASISASHGPKNDEILATSRCLLLRKIPIEVRRLVYDYIWEENGLHKHVYSKRGRLHMAPCVMRRMDEEPDFIQKQMDRVEEARDLDSFRDDRMKMWHRRRVFSWGYRHWRCEERIKDFMVIPKDEPSNSGGVFINMLLVCKTIYPEIMASILESHTFIFHEVPSAYNFFILQPPMLFQQLRHVEIAFSACFSDFENLYNGADVHPSNRILAVLDSLTKLSCIHNLRVSFDVFNRQCWVELPEQALLEAVGKLKAQRSFVVELPPYLPGKEASENVVKDGFANTPFEIIRRPMLRYWPLMDTVEKITWKKSRGTCCIQAASDFVVWNPYQNGRWALD
ncbi:hypothetical protein BX600DRAFT_429571 [Xylariales sp. PMI_506]|nr:hypothetical protein BX600DRAFT_429571 [Xylariales sp. PMI_506]